MQELIDRGRIVYHQGLFDPCLLEGVTPVIAATDYPELNAQVAWKARQRGLLVNAVDKPEQGNFLVPATLRRGPLTISVSTSGLSPLFGPPHTR